MTYRLVVTQSRPLNKSNIVSYIDGSEISVTIDFNEFMKNVKSRIVGMNFTKKQLDDKFDKAVHEVIEEVKKESANLWIK